LEEQGLLAFGVLGGCRAQGVAKTNPVLARGCFVDRQGRSPVWEGALLIHDTTFEGLADIQGWGFRAWRASELWAAFESIS
jgi:hypothetical protein